MTTVGGLLIVSNAEKCHAAKSAIMMVAVRRAMGLFSSEQSLAYIEAMQHADDEKGDYYDDYSITSISSTVILYSTLDNCMCTKVLALLAEQVHEDRQAIAD